MNNTILTENIDRNHLNSSRNSPRTNINYPQQDIHTDRRNSPFKQNCTLVTSQHCYVPLKNINYSINPVFPQNSLVRPLNQKIIKTSCEPKLIISRQCSPAHIKQMPPTPLTKISHFKRQIINS